MCPRLTCHAVSLRLSDPERRAPDAIDAPRDAVRKNLDAGKYDPDRPAPSMVNSAAIMTPQHRKGGGGGGGGCC